jgi:hypothetical protein
MAVMAPVVTMPRVGAGGAGEEREGQNGQDDTLH